MGKLKEKLLNNLSEAQMEDIFGISRMAPAERPASSSIQGFNMCLGNAKGLITMSGEKLKITLASISTPNSAANAFIRSTSVMPGSVSVKSRRICLGLVAIASP